MQNTALGQDKKKNKEKRKKINGKREMQKRRYFNCI